MRFNYPIITISENGGAFVPFSDDYSEIQICKACTTQTALTLKAENPGFCSGWNYEWTVLDPFTNSWSTPTTTQTFAVPYPDVNSVIQLNLYNTGCDCNLYRTFELLAYPNLEMQAQRNVICENEEVQITANLSVSTGCPATYDWSMQNGSTSNYNFSITDSYVFDPDNFTNGGSNLYSFYCNGISGCTNTLFQSGLAWNYLAPGCTGAGNLCETANTDIVVDGTPPSLTNPNTIYCYKNCPVDISVTSSGTSNFFSWFPSDFLSSPFGSTVTCTPTSTGTFPYTVLVKDNAASDYGCCSYAEIEIVVQDGDITLSWINQADFNWKNCSSFTGHLQLDYNNITPDNIAWYDNGVLITGITGNDLYGALPGHNYYAVIIPDDPFCPNGIPTNIISIPDCYIGAAHLWQQCICRSEDSVTLASGNWNAVVFPNPNTGNFTLTVTSERKETSEEYVVDLFSSIGRAVGTRSMVLSAGNNLLITQLNLMNVLDNGVYFLRIRNSSEESKTISIIVNHE